MASWLQVTPERIAEVRAHPAFHQAMREEAQTGIAFFDVTQPFHQALNDMAGFALGLVALSLHFTGGLTHRRLRLGIGRGGLVSGGRATAILWRLRSSRLVQPVEADDSGRARAFAPDPILVEIYRERFRLVLTAIGRLDSSVAEVAARLDEEAVFRSFVLEFTGAIIASAEKPEPPLQPINRLTMKNCGLLILYHLIEGAFAGGGARPIGPAVLNIAAVSRRLGVSRTHLYRYLDEMARGGLLRRDADPAVVHLTPAFADLFERYYAGGFAGMANVCRRVLELQPASGSTPAA